jgi:hypothetical protein
MKYRLFENKNSIQLLLLLLDVMAVLLFNVFTLGVKFNIWTFYSKLHTGHRPGGVWNFRLRLLWKL